MVASHRKVTHLTYCVKYNIFTSFPKLAKVSKSFTAQKDMGVMFTDLKNSAFDIFVNWRYQFNVAVVF